MHQPDRKDWTGRSAQFLALAVVLSLAAITARAQSTSGGPYQVGRASNLNIGNSYINLSNSSASPICAHIFTFDPNEEFISESCCAVPAMSSAYMTVTDGPSSVDFSLVAGTGDCSTGGTLVSGLFVATTTLNLNTHTGTYFSTMSPFQNAELIGGNTGNAPLCGLDPPCSAGVAPFGSINVITNLSAATFTITGPATYSGSGTSFTQPLAPSGEYTISYGAVPGYQTPPNQSLTLANGGTITFTGTYIPFPPGTYQVRYAASLQTGESFINLINDGANGAPLNGPGIGGTTGNICVNVYAFDANEEMISCCSCLVTPDQVVNLGVSRDIASNTATGVVPTSVTIKLLATLAGSGGSGTSCTNSAAGVATGALATGLEAFGTTLHAQAAGFGTTETPFVNATLSPGELNSLGNRCTKIVGNLSGFGICASCRTGALGSDKI